MQSLRNSVGLIALGVSSCLACSRTESPPEGKASSAASVAPSVAAAAPAAAAAQPTSTSTATKGVCPYPRRCDDACKKAHFVAIEKCSPLWKEVEKALPNVNEMGACTAACLKSPNSTGCVGAATKEECACTDKCSEGVSPALRAKGEGYLNCYDITVREACY